jgi:hypothetical protein
LKRTGTTDFADGADIPSAGSLRRRDRGEPSAKWRVLKDSTAVFFRDCDRKKWLRSPLREKAFHS